MINIKLHNVFIAAHVSEIQYYSALARSLDSSLGNMPESIAISIAKLNYEVSQHVEGTLTTSKLFILKNYMSNIGEKRIEEHQKQLTIDEYKKKCPLNQ